MKIPLVAISNVGLRTRLEPHAQDGSIDLSLVATNIDDVLRRHFTCDSFPAHVVGINVLVHKYPVAGLRETIQREAGVSIELAKNIVKLVRRLPGAERYVSVRSTHLAAR